MATRSRGGATRTIQPKEDKCGCRPSKGDGACCKTGACGCHKNGRGCGPKCGCYGATGGRHPCTNPYTVGGAPRPSREGSSRRRSAQEAFAGHGFALGSAGVDGDLESLTPCPICSRLVPQTNVAMHAARCGVPERPSATAIAEHERQFTRIQQESEYEAALRQDEEKAFAEQERKEDEERAASRRRRLAQRRADELEIVRQRLGPPPDGDCGEATTTIRIRLLSGAQVQRRFLASSSLQSLFDFVDTSAPPSDIAKAEFASPTPYVLRLQFPATEFVRPSSVAEVPTLQALGLCPNALLLAEEQAMAAARATDQVKSTSDQDAARDSDWRDLSAQAVRGAAAAERGREAAARSATAQAAPTEGGQNKRARVDTADTPLQRPAPKRADVVDLLSSDEEDDVPATSAPTTGSCWACNVCTYAGNSVVAQRCQICDHPRD